MEKVKNYLLLVFIVIALILAWQFKSMTLKRNQERADKERWQGNFMEATKTAIFNKNIVLEQKEFLTLYKDSVKKLTDSLHIKPKTITKYEIKYVTQRETISVEVPVYKIAQGSYTINDSGPCFSWQGKATILTLDSLEVKRTAFTYNNTIEDLFYRKQKGRFLFWKTYYKDKIERVSVPKCGTSQTTTLEVR